MFRSRNSSLKNRRRWKRQRNFTRRSKRDFPLEETANFMKMAFKIFALIGLLAAAFSASGQTDPKSKKPLPTLFIIGDSTVNNSSEGFQGWGNVVGDLFDKTKINVENRARGGRSS